MGLPESVALIFTLDIGMWSVVIFETYTVMVVVVLTKLLPSL